MQTSDEPGFDDDPGRSGPPPEDPMALAKAMLGSIVASRYELISVLGVGALGRVFRARVLTDRSEVALKLLHDRHAGDALIQQRFAREVEAARHIDHPCVVRVLDSGIDERGRPFVCMECLDGKSLGAILRHEELSARRIESLLTDMLSALSAAHRQGVVHRDLKPDNVIVVRESDGRETAKLCDFGVAKILRQEVGSSLTLDGMLCGTPEYMAPEQASGKNLDGRVDVYSVGVVLYQMLARELPFQGNSPVATAAMHTTDVVRAPSQRRPDRSVPMELEAVCLKALAKRPTERYQTAIEMSEAVREAVKKLDGRADVPLGGTTFGHSLSQISNSAAPERLTEPGTQLHSRTRAWLGALLLLAASAAIAFPMLKSRESAPAKQHGNSQVHAGLAPPTAKPSVATAPISKGEAAFSEGKRRLRRNDLAGAVSLLSDARKELGDRPDVLRVLGEAEIKLGHVDDGRNTLARYLELSPDARDRVIVEGLMKAPATR